MKISRITYLALLGIGLAGCGGGAGGGSAIVSTPAPTETMFAAGEISGMAAISNPPVTTATNNCVATGLTGSFSILKLRELNPTLNATRIYFSSNLDGPEDIYSMSPDGSDVQRITTNADAWTPGVSQTGKLAYAAHQPNNTYQIVMSSVDGSNPVPLTSTSSHTYPTFNAAGDKIADLNPTLNVVEIIDVASKTVTPLPRPAGAGSCFSPCMSPDGKTIYFGWLVGQQSFVYSVSTAGGSGPALLTEMDGYYSYTLTPDGHELAGMNGDPGGVARLGIGSLSVFKTPLSISGFDGASFSPDGKKIVFAGGTANTVTTGFYVFDTVSGTAAPISSPTMKCVQPAWGPFTKDRTLIASGGGLLGTHACGVIQTQKAATTTSVIALDATTPSSVVMTAQTAQSGQFPNLVFSIDADNITKLAFANYTGWRGVRAIGTGTPVTSANGALVTINAGDGSVVSILPFTGTRGIESKPTVSAEGTTRVFRGNFLAAYDKDGKNLAPNGASTVKVDASGKITAE